MYLGRGTSQRGQHRLSLGLRVRPASLRHQRVAGGHRGRVLGGRGPRSNVGGTAIHVHGHGAALDVHAREEEGGENEELEAGLPWHKGTTTMPMPTEIIIYMPCLIWNLRSRFSRSAMALGVLLRFFLTRTAKLCLTMANGFRLAFSRLVVDEAREARSFLRADL